MYPILLESSGLIVYSYPLFMGLAWGLAYTITKNSFIKENISQKILWQLFLGVFVSAWIGAKVFYLLFSAKDKAALYAQADYFWLGGGFIFYGGLIFGLVFYFYYCVVLKKFDFKKSHLLVSGLVVGHAVGRVGCFLAGCCFGSESHLPWSVAHEGLHRHPVQLYEALYLVAFALYALSNRHKKTWQKSAVYSYILYYSVGRFGLEFFRGDEIRGQHWLNLSTSQYVSLFLILSALVAHLCFKLKKPIGS